jgi:hypothetical protein
MQLGLAAKFIWQETAFRYDLLGGAQGPAAAPRNRFAQECFVYFVTE